MKESIKTIFRLLPGRIRAPMERAAPFFENEAKEIILRAECPVAIECGHIRYYLHENGTLTTDPRNTGLTVSLNEIADALKSICDYSIYARQNELNHGYITIENGVRVGICGTVVENEHGIRNIKDVTTLSFRVSTDHVGCANDILKMVDPLDGILLCGPPCSGKTTIIRDLARTLSKRCKVCIIDERNEISATHHGHCGYDVGMCDVFVGMKKCDGVIRALRSLSPDIIVCDELGDSHDAETLRETLRCGAAFIATVHASSVDDLRHRSATAGILATGAFRYAVLLGDRCQPGRIESIDDLRDEFD